MNALVISSVFGLVVAVTVWVIYKVFSDVPNQDRSYLDRPPLGFRLTWPLISLLAHYVGTNLSIAYKDATNMRLLKAGVNYSIDASQFFAAKIIGSLCMACFSLLLGNMLGGSSPVYALAALVFGFYYPEIWLKETTTTRNQKIFKELPFFLDVITLSVESGTNLTSGIAQAVEKAPESPLRVEFSRVLRDVRAGKARAQSLRDFSERTSSEGVNNVVSGMIQAEKTGASLGPVLRAQSDQLRTSRFLKAEKMAMEAPVKLLGPLVMFIFPTTFIVILFVMLSKALGDGILTWEPLVWAFTHPR